MNTLYDTLHQACLPRPKRTHEAQDVARPKQSSQGGAYPMGVPGILGGHP